MITGAGGVVRYVELDEAAGWRLDVGAVAAVCGPQTAAILIANPNNPTGHCYPAEQLEELAELARRVGCVLVSDEVYRDFVFDGGIAYSLAQNAAYRDVVIRVFSFSKAYAMTGCRVAYVHGAAEVMRRIVGAHDNLVTCAPVVSQYAAMAAIRHGEPYLALFRAALKRRRTLVCAWLDGQGDLFDYARPEAAYFVFPRLRATGDDWGFTRELLREAGVAVVPGSAFGPNGAGHVRLCFGRSDDDLRRAMRRIEQWRETK
jgi:aspartate/methionine/tyrosine aminotransferase